MCEFASWIEYQDKIYYLDDNKLNTKEGRKLLKYLGEGYEDLPGHGSIRWYYPELNCKGKDKECTDFSTPNNFPPEIVEAIKKGLFVNFGACPQILTPSAFYLFINSETGIIYAEWKKADAEREKADAESEKAYAKWEKTYAKWEKAYARWEKAYAEWEKADKTYFWQLARVKKNRVKAWQ